MTRAGMVNRALGAWHCPRVVGIRNAPLRQLARIPAGSWRREGGQAYGRARRAPRAGQILMTHVCRLLAVDRSESTVRSP